MQYSLNEITLLASAYPTDIDSRSQISPYTSDGKLPIFVSPMTSILNEANFDVFASSNVIPVAPRNFNNKVEFSKKYWTAFSLPEFKSLFVSGNTPKLESGSYHVLVDIANGHMKTLYDCSKIAKEIYKDGLTLMVGNIEHPRMYLECCQSGIDYVRVGVGGGSVCSTSSEGGHHASHPWLIEGIKEYQKLENDYKYRNSYPLWTRTKTIADGGINTIDKAIKCLGLGYDYVMMGQLFAQCKEACGETKKEFVGYQRELNDQKFKTIESTYRKYYGMASEQGQIDISGGVKKHSEGIEKWVLVNTNLKDFLDLFEGNLRSSMSYAGAHNLEEFRQTKYDVQSISEFNSFHK